MAIREIKATLELDGEKKFNQTLNDASRNLRVMDSGLKAVEASYGVTGDRSQMLAKRSEVLGEELEQQKRIVSALSQALQEAEKKYGDTSSKTDGYRIKLNNALKKQAEMEKAIRDTEREMDELGRESISTGRDIQRGIGDAAEDATKSLRGMYDQFKNDIDVLKGSAVASAVTDAGGFVIDAISGAMDFVESNRDYRAQIAFVEQGIRDAKLDVEATKSLIYEAASFTGDFDGAAEAMQNLLDAGFDLEELGAVMANLTGLHIRNPESFRIETVAESLRETVQQAQATGVFADYLTTLSDDLKKPAEKIIEEFNNAMEIAEDLDERQAVVMHYLGQGGGQATKIDFAEREKELIAARAAQIELTNAWAELAEEIEPLLTGITGMLSGAVEWATGEIRRVKTFLETGDIEELLRPAGEDYEDGALVTIIKGIAGRGSNAENIGGRIRETIEDQESIYEVRGKQGNVEDAGKEAGEAYIDAAIEAITQRTGDGSNIFEAMNDHFAEITAEQTRYEDFANKARAEAEAAKADAGGFFTSIWDAITGGGGADEENAKQKGTGIVESVQDGIEEAEPAATGAAKTVGANVMTEMGNGINEAAPYAISATAGVVDGINAEFARIVIPDVGAALTRTLYSRAVSARGGNGSTTGGSAGGGSTTVNMYMDSHKVGEAVIPTVSAGIGRQIDTAITLG